MNYCGHWLLVFISWIIIACEKRTMFGCSHYSLRVCESVFAFNFCVCLEYYLSFFCACPLYFAVCVLDNFRVLGKMRCALYVAFACVLCLFVVHKLKNESDFRFGPSGKIEYWNGTFGWTSSPHSIRSDPKILPLRVARRVKQDNLPSSVWNNWNRSDGLRFPISIHILFI